MARGKAVSNSVGIEAMGSRFNVLLTVQIPLKQKKEEKEEIHYSCVRNPKQTKVIPKLHSAHSRKIQSI